MVTCCCHWCHASGYLQDTSVCFLSLLLSWVLLDFTFLRDVCCQIFSHRNRLPTPECQAKILQCSFLSTDFGMNVFLIMVCQHRQFISMIAQRMPLSSWWWQTQSHWLKLCLNGLLGSLLQVHMPPVSLWFGNVRSTMCSYPSLVLMLMHSIYVSCHSMLFHMLLCAIPTSTYSNPFLKYGLNASKYLILQEKIQLEN